MPSYREIAEQLNAVQPITNSVPTIRREVERQAILAGMTPIDAATRLLDAHGDLISIGTDGVVRGVEEAIAARKETSPSEFIALPKIAMNEKLPATQRFAESYRAVVKARSSQAQLERLTAHAVSGGRYPRAGNLNRGTYVGPRASRRQQAS